MLTARQLWIVSALLLTPVACFSDVSGTSDTTAGSDSESDSPSTTETDDETESTTDESSTETGDELDTTSPTIVAISPEDGATGVWADATIVITFSEPMSRVATQAAWQSADIVGVVMQWNADDTELTIVPNNPLPYGTGDSDETTQAIEYSFTIDITATDVAGNALELPATSSFFTWRHITTQLEPIHFLTGMVHTDSIVSINSPDLYIGDTQFDSHQKSVITFELPVFPPTFESVVSAVLSTHQMYVSGSPYGPLPGLGVIHLLDVVYQTAAEGFHNPASSDLGIFSDNPTIETKSHDVTSAVTDDYTQGRASTQFRLEFEIGTNGNGVLDRVTFTRDSVSLGLEYLAR
jgi:hypothetical protein